MKSSKLKKILKLTLDKLCNFRYLSIFRYFEWRYNLKNNSKNEEDSKLLEALLYFIIPVVISLPITDFLDWWYYKFQKSNLSTGNTLLFIHSNVANKVIFYVPFIIVFFIVLSIRNTIKNGTTKINVFALIAIVIFIISAFILLFEFFNYTDINKEGICIRNGMFLSNKNYNWNDVADVEVSYKRGYKGKMDIIYNIYLNDGTIINTWNSKDFFSNIENTDNFIKDKKVKITRNKVKSSDYNDFNGSFSEDRLKIALEILNE